MPSLDTPKNERAHKQLLNFKKKKKKKKHDTGVRKMYARVTTGAIAGHALLELVGVDAQHARVHPINKLDGTQLRTTRSKTSGPGRRR
jgi:hypothetical protein